MNILLFISRNIDYIVTVALILAAIGLLVFIYLKLREKMISKLVYSRSFSEIGAYEGEHLIFTETIYNPTVIPIFSINIEGYIYNGIRMKETVYDSKKSMQYFVSRFNIMPFQQIKRSHDIICDSRGYYRLETVYIYYNKKKRYIDAPAELYIYPGLISLSERAEPINIYQGDAVTQRTLIKDPFSFSGIRQYTFGDPFNSINFKATARSGGADISSLRVNSRESCSNRIFMVYLNFQTGGGETVPTVAYNKMMELGLSFSADIIREAAYSGHRAGFASNPVTIDGDTYLRFPVESGDSHLIEILKQMAKVRNRAGISFSSLLEHDIKQGISESEIYIITPYTDDDIEDLAYRLRALGNSVCTVILTDEEKEQRVEDEIKRNKLMAQAMYLEQEKLKARELAAIERRLRKQGYKKSAAHAEAKHKFESMYGDSGTEPENKTQES